jgi:hypothetical protein
MQDALTQSGAGLYLCLLWLLRVHGEQLIKQEMGMNGQQRTERRYCCYTVACQIGQRHAQRIWQANLCVTVGADQAYSGL